MREGIRVRPLGDVCDILDSRRKPITKRNRVPGPYPYYGATGVLDYVESYIFDEPLVLIGEDGAKWGAGERTAYAVEGKYWVNNHAHVIRPNRDLMLDSWVIYYLNAIDLAPFVSGLTVPKLNQGRLREIPIPLPPIPEQKRIVAILDEAFAGIAIAVDNTEKNLANGRELFESYLNAVLSEQRDGWIEKPLGECFRLKSGDALTNSKMVRGKFSVFGGNGIAGTHDKNNLAGENVIIGRVGALCGNARYVNEPIWLTDNAFKVVDKQYAIDDRFLVYLLNFKNLRGYARQSAQPVISNSSLRDVELRFPESGLEQRRLVTRLDELDADIGRLSSVYQQKRAALAELKQSLLQKAFSGELTAAPQDEIEAALG